MERLKGFLKNYDTIVFDMDGVITKESTYWDASALSVWELLNSCSYYGDEILDAKEIEEKKDEIRKIVFDDDKVITVLKKKGVNNNWDLAFITLFVILKNQRDFTKTLDYVKTFSKNILDDFEKIEKEFSSLVPDDTTRGGELWIKIRDSFQEWYTGDEIYKGYFKKEPVLKGKTGLMGKETPIVDEKKLKEIFKILSQNGKRLCIATGRPKDEAITPLKSFGLWEYVDKNSIITFDHVLKAEGITGKTLTKPHPYMFVKSALGEDFSDEKIANGDYEISKRTLGVGDAGSDLFSAKGGGMDFLAVLTGVSGEEAREYFEKEGADYILHSLEDFLK